MVLSDRTIKEELARGHIVIRPLDQADIQPASVDVHLDNKIRVFRAWQYPYVIDLRMPLDGLTELVTIERETHFSLQPGQFVLASTVEYVEVPDDIMARLEGKSSLGRVGLMIHATAGYVDPGWKGRLTLELSNASTLPILLYPGMKISQISFHRLTTPADRPYGSQGLKSKYQGQVEPTATRAHQDFAQFPLLSAPMLPAARPAKETLAPSDGLRGWLKHSKFHGSVSRFAEALGVPQKTVEDWVYRGARPNAAHWAKLLSLNLLPESPEADTAKPAELPSSSP